jgi:hypothetical protein
VRSFVRRQAIVSVELLLINVLAEESIAPASVRSKAIVGDAFIWSASWRVRPRNTLEYASVLDWPGTPAKRSGVARTLGCADATFVDVGVAAAALDVGAHTIVDRTRMGPKTSVQGLKRFVCNIGPLLKLPTPRHAHHITEESSP